MPISEPTAVFSIRDDRDMEIKQAVLQVYRALEVSSVMRAAHDSSFCGRSQGDFAPASATKGLSDRPLETFGLTL